MRVPRIVCALAFLSVVCAAAHAQSEAHLRQHFEGKRVAARIEMPATKDGINVYPGSVPALRYDRLATDIKRNGTALRPGDEALVTKVKVKRDLIEFHLGGGGFGTAFDDSSTAVYAPAPGRSNREKDLERDLKKVTDPAERKKLQRELDDLRRDRERAEAHIRVLSEQAEEMKKERVRRQALEGGSRFNLRYPGGVPAAALTPEAVTAALAEFLDFGADFGAGGAAQEARAPMTEASGPARLHKGMSWQQVLALLGEPAGASERAEGALTVRTATFYAPDALVEADFVEGVLIAFRMRSR